MRKTLFLRIAGLSTLLFLLSFAFRRPEPVNTKHTVQVLGDGSFDPEILKIRVGDTVEWVSKYPGEPVDPIHRIPPELKGQSNCNLIHPFQETDPNEFTGPMPRAVAGVTVLSPIGRNSRGFTIDPATGDLRQDAPDFMTMDASLNNPAVSTVFIRFRWNTIHGGPGKFNWKELDREIGRAVKAGKFYSLSFKAGLRGTPDWIFDKEACAPRPPVRAYHFVDKGEGEDIVRDDCGVEMRLGSPADPVYQQYYFEMWKAVAEHVKERNDWYRALAWVKPSGANLITHENRLPYKCEPGCLCNAQVWSEEAHLRPRDIVYFYLKQFELLADLFPQKDISYMLIQGGFPQLTADGKWQAPPGDSLIKSATLVEDILALGRKMLPGRFAAQHNGLRPFRPGADCPSRSANGCPNYWVVQSGNQGSWTGFQTVNKLETAADLDSTLKNLWRHSEATFVELYEDLVYAVTRAGGVVDPAKGSTLTDWNRRLIGRRDAVSTTGPQYPLRHVHVFQRPNRSGSGEIRYDYANIPRCPGNGGRLNKGALLLSY